MAESSRDARRRRILDRGTDRIALITGQTRNLPSDDSDLPQSDSPSYKFSSSPPTRALSPSSPPSSFDLPPIEDRASGSLLPNHQPSEVVSSRDRDRKGSSIEGPSQVQNPSLSAHLLNILAYLQKVIPFNEVKSAISTSEDTRTLYSVAAAILVVLAYIGFPIIGWRPFKSIICLRPLYLLLLTNITVVIQRFLEMQQGLQGSEPRATGNSSLDELGITNHLSAALELSLFLLNVTNTLFMDCGIYAITLVCGISLARSIGL